jgi:hypothetical protein
MKIEGSGSASESGSISKRHGSADPDPDPHQNVKDLEHCRQGGAKHEICRRQGSNPGRLRHSILIYWQ